MTTLVYLLLQVARDTSTVKLLVEPVSKSMFSESITIEIIQVIGLVVVAVIGGIVSYQVAKLHHQVNSQMDKMMKLQKELSERVGKEKEQAAQKLRDESGDDYKNSIS